MRTAESVLNIIRERGRRGLPLEEVYRLLYRQDLYLRAYAKLYRNDGAMTRGTTEETVDGMSLGKIDAIIEALRFERYQWTPVRRTYIPKKNGKLRPLGMPTWSDKLLQEVIRQVLEAYYEPQFSDNSHGFRPKRGCHTALREIRQRGKGTKWFIEGDICACFDKINHEVLLRTLGEKIHDNRFLRLMKNLLNAGYLEDWKMNTTYSGVPQGGVISPILSNLILDKLDKFIETQLIPSNTRGQRRKTNTRYVALTVAASRAREKGELEKVKSLMKQAQTIPSREPNDPNFRRLWYVRYADDFLLGFTGPKVEAMDIKQKLSDYLKEELQLEMSEEKTLITNAREEKAKFLGYEIHVLHEDSKHNDGCRCINGSVGLCVPRQVVLAHCAKYMRQGKPAHLTARVSDSAYSVVSQYQAEYSGIVQYYRLAYNLHTLSKLKWITELSLVKTLAQKFRCKKTDIYQRYKTEINKPEGVYKVLQVIEERPGKKPLKAHFGGISLIWNSMAVIGEYPNTIWSKRSELLNRLLAQECELCGKADGGFEVHHIRKLADLKNKQKWEQLMAARRRKTLIVCRPCHEQIHAGLYNGPALSSKIHRRAG